jgi:hypothetical protein
LSSNNIGDDSLQEINRMLARNKKLNSDAEQTNLDKICKTFAEKASLKSDVVLNIFELTEPLDVHRKITLAAGKLPQEDNATALEEGFANLVLRRQGSNNDAANERAHDASGRER